MSTLLTMTPKEFCKATKPCFDGRDYALTQPTMADVWDHCPRPDWMFWLLHRLRRKTDDRTLRLFAAWCAVNTPMANGRKTGDLLTDHRSIAAINVAKRYANGEATKKELDAAASAARDAALTADDTAQAAASAAAWAARDAARAAAWTDAKTAKEAARNAAYYSSDAALAASRVAASVAALTAGRIAQANQLRAMVANPFKAVKNQNKP